MYVIKLIEYLALADNSIDKKVMFCQREFFFSKKKKNRNRFG